MNYAALILSLLLPFSTVQANGDTWQLKRDAKGIQVSQQATPSGYATTRGSVEVDSSVDALITVIRDNAACHRWLHQCRQSRLIEQINPTTRLDYFVIDSPFLYADRDMYTYSELTYDDATQTFLISILGKEAYDKGHPRRVRIKDLKGFWRMKKSSTNKTAVTYQVYSNPQIAPSGFLNNVLADSVFNTLSKIVKVSKEDKYRDAQIIELK